MNVYLDNSATTRLDKRAFEKMKPYITDEYGNASSIHSMGQRNHLVLIKAKEDIAKIINCDKDNIVFTSGATESNSMIIKGVAMANIKKGNHILVSSIEHPSVLKSAEQLKQKGFEVELIPVGVSGVVDLEQIKKMVKPSTILISVMAVNNEIGTIQPIEKIGAFAKKNNIFFHVDAVQAVPYLIVDIKKWNVDFLSLSAHKFYGPKGVGLAYINRKISLSPIIPGGGQEYGLRGGTYNIPGIVGMAEALKIAYKERDEYIKKVTALKDHLWNRIQKEIDDAYLNGDPVHRTPNNLNLRIERIEGEAMLMDLSVKGVYVSTGSACSAENLRASGVLQAIGLKDELLNSNIRITLGRFNTKEEVDYTVDCLKDTVKRLRSFTPIR
jgi:cysteine desulfurase